MDHSPTRTVAPSQKAAHSPVYLTHETNDLAYAIKTRSRKHAEYLRQHDMRRFGKKMEFCQLREPSSGFIQTLQTRQAVTATLAEPLAYGLVTLTVDAPTPWDLTKHVKLNDHVATIVSVNDRDIELMMHDEPEPLPQPIVISQEVIILPQIQLQ